jgi:hypothetical protein
MVGLCFGESLMAKEKKFQQTKTDVEPFMGGVRVNLKKKIKDKGPLKEVLSREIDNVLSIELRNQAKLIKKHEKWNKQYRGIKKSSIAVSKNGVKLLRLILPRHILVVV